MANAPLRPFVVQFPFETMLGISMDPPCRTRHSNFVKVSSRGVSPGIKGCKRGTDSSF